METKLGEMELRFAGAENIISARDKEIDKAALEESKNNWYNMGYVDAENSTELAMFQSQKYGFSEGWMVTVLAIGVPEDSPFKDLIRSLTQRPLHPFKTLLM